VYHLSAIMCIYSHQTVIIYVKSDATIRQALLTLYVGDNSFSSTLWSLSVYRGTVSKSPSIMQFLLSRFTYTPFPRRRALIVY